LSAEQRTLREALESWLAARQADERAQLTERRRAHGTDQTAVQQLHKEGESLRRVHGVADELMEMGTDVLDTLRRQGLSMENIRRKMVDIGSTLGLSHAVIRHIERRLRTDRLLVYGGMIVTLLVFGLLVYYFRS
jgi:Golgi SNAP receptor complex protein 2